MPIMITVKYQRIPMKERYKFSLSVDRVEGDQETEMTTLEEYRIVSTMEDMGGHLHRILNQYPSAIVTMIQKPTREPVNKQPLRGHQLDESLAAVIRGSEEKARELFSPILRTVKVGGLNPPQKTEGEEHAG